MFPEELRSPIQSSDCQGFERLPAAASVSTAAAAATAATAVSFSPSFVHVERSSVEILPIESIDGGSRFGVRHADESESTRPSGFPVSDHGDFLDIAMGCECIAQSVFTGVEAEVSYIDLQGVSPGSVGQALI